MIMPQLDDHARPDLEELNIASLDDALSTLLVRIGQGDICSFTELYDVTDKRIYSLALRHSGGAEAELLTQRIYVALWHRASTFVPQRHHALAWVISLAHHEMAHQQRCPGSGLTDGRRTSHVTTAPAGSVDVDMSALTPFQQDVLTLVCLGGYSARDVAELMQMSRASVTRTVRVGLSRIRAELPAAS